MSENKKLKATDKSSVDSSHPVSKNWEKESLFKDGEQFIVIPFNRPPKPFKRAGIDAANGGTSRTSAHAAEH